MLLSKEVDGLGTLHYPINAAGQISDLVDDVAAYFDHGIDIRAGATVVDVGANMGVFAMACASRCDGNLTLLCFEPIPQNFEILERNIDSVLPGRRGTHLFNLGLTSIGGPNCTTFSYFKRLPCDTTQQPAEKYGEFVSFFRSSGDGGGAGGFARTLLARFGEQLHKKNSLARKAFDKAIGTTEVECPLRPLSDCIREAGVTRIDLLKVDVEGAELAVLEGIEDEHWRIIDQAVLEIHDFEGRLEKIKAMLHKAGITEIHTSIANVALDRGLNNVNVWARRPH